MEDLVQGLSQTAPRPGAAYGPATLLQKFLDRCDVRIGGSRPWDMVVNDNRFALRVLRDGSLGFGESYMDGWWDAQDLEGLLDRLVAGRLDRQLGGWRALLTAWRAAFINPQALGRAGEVGRVHYDLGNAMYRRMLGENMVYSCGYWEHARTVDEAQAAKLDLVYAKLGLRPGMRVLDIGCGWGEALRRAAANHGISGVGVTISQEQAAFARERCSGLPIDIRLQDYRGLTGTFDRVFSIGMFEHVGPKNYRVYMETARRVLKEDGLFLLHTIGANEVGYNANPWIEKYIFPNSALPAVQQIADAVQDLFLIEDWHNFGADYAPTLQAWRRNFEAGWAADGHSRDDRFYRMWRLYLTAMAALFKARRAQLWQIVLSPKGVPGGYRRPMTANPLRDVAMA